MPYDLSLSINVLWGTVSKAFMKSKYTTSIDSPLSRALVHESITFNSWSTIERPLLKPNCCILNLLFLIICLTIWSLTHYSIHLYIILVKLTAFFRFLLNMAEILPCFHSFGSSPTASELLNSLASGLRRWLDNSFNKTSTFSLSESASLDLGSLGSEFRSGQVI